MKTMEERLAEARKAANFDTPGDAAAALGMAYSTYAAHENGTTGFKIDKAIQYAKKFKVSLDWLLTGKGRGPSSEGQKAWEIYQMIADLPEDDLDFVEQAVVATLGALKKPGRAA